MRVVGPSAGIARAVTGVLALALVACAKRAQTTQPNEETTARQATQRPVPAVCLLDNAGFWASATAEKGTGQFLAAISLGEVVMWAGEEEMGKSYSGEAQKFYKVRTSADDEGWVEEPYFAVRARPVVSVEETLRYQRDNATSAAGSHKVPTMTVAALLEERGDWARVAFGGRRDLPFLAGYAARDYWVKKATLSASEDDLTVAVLGLRALLMESASAKARALTTVLDDRSYADSVFIPLLREECARAQGRDEVQVKVD